MSHEFKEGRYVKHVRIEHDWQRFELGEATIEMQPSDMAMVPWIKFGEKFWRVNAMDHIELYPDESLGLKVQGMKDKVHALKEQS